MKLIYQILNLRIQQRIVPKKNYYEVLTTIDLKGKRAKKQKIGLNTYEYETPYFFKQFFNGNIV